MPQRSKLVFLSLVLLGCPPPADFGPKGEPKDADELLKRIAQAELTVVSIKGDAKLKVDSSAQKGSVTLFAAVKDPASLHIESLDFFGRPQGALVSDGKRFGLYDGKEGKYYRGPATAENVGRFVPISLSPGELAAVLLGRAPRLPDAVATMVWDPEKRVYALTLTRDQAIQRLEVKPPTYRVVKSRVTGMHTYDLDFGDIEVVGAVSYPRQVSLAANDDHLSLDYHQIEINTDLEDSMFQINPPANVPVIEVDGHGNAVP